MKHFINGLTNYEFEEEIISKHYLEVKHLVSICSCGKVFDSKNPSDLETKHKKHLLEVKDKKEVK